MLICFLVWYEKCDDGEEDDSDVEPERPVLDIPDVLLYALLHFPQLFRLAAAAAHLSPSGDAGEAEMSYHVFVDDFSILLGVCQHVRSGSYDAHVAFEDIEELRELIDVGMPDEVAEREFSWVVLGGLHLVGVAVDVHGPELVTCECFPVESRSLLLEEDGSRALPFDEECYDGNERQQNHAHDGTKHDVEDPFHKSVERM